MVAAVRVANCELLADTELAELGCALRDTLCVLALGESAAEAESLWGCIGTHLAAAMVGRSFSFACV